MLRYQFANEIVLDLIRHSDLKIQSFVLINEVLSSVAFFSPTVDLCDLVQLLGGHGVGYREGGGSVAGAPGASTVAAWALGGARNLGASGVAALDAGPRSTHTGHREMPPLRAGSRQAGDGHSACLDGGGEFGRGHRLVVDVVSLEGQRWIRSPVVYSAWAVTERTG